MTLHDLSYKKPTSGEIRSLTGLRGVAACYVMMYHFYQNREQGGPGYTALNHGYLAVDLFFVLSGFVMALTYGKQFEGRFSFGDYVDFLFKRLARVYPLYFAVTLAAVMVGMMGLFPNDDGLTDVRTVASNLLMIQQWGLSGSIIGPTWSISAEFTIYLIFPLLVTLVLGGSTRRLIAIHLIATALVVLLATRSVQALHHEVAGRMGPLDIYDWHTIYPMLRCLTGFVLGLVAYGLAFRVRAMGRFSADLTLLVMLALLFIPNSDIAIVLLCPMLTAALIPGRSVCARMLGGRVLHFLGEISYSIYLMHELLHRVLQWKLNAILAASGVPHAFTLARVAVTVLVLPASAATYYLIERPARQWLRTLFGARIRSIGGEPAAP